jgi:DNA-binding GntR family transcriptional regulator
MALALHAGRRLGVKDLMELTGFSKNPVLEGLEALRRLGLAERMERYQGWQATDVARIEFGAWLP